MSGCVFCDIVKDGGLPIIDKRPDVVVMEPLNPVTTGHVLAVPTVHVRDALERPGLTARVMECAVLWAKAGDAHRSGWNFITSVGAAATQTVFHLHVHVVPRHEGDGLKLPWTGQRHE